jgi:hypothetical protein
MPDDATHPLGTLEVRFERLVERGRADLAGGANGVFALRQALALWRGPAFAGLDRVPVLRRPRRWGAYRHARHLPVGELASGRAGSSSASSRRS